MANCLFGKNNKTKTTKQKHKMKNKYTTLRWKTIGVLTVVCSVALSCLAGYFSYCKTYPPEVVMNAPGQPGYSNCQSLHYPNCDGSACGIIVQETHCEWTPEPWETCYESTCASTNLLGDAHCRTIGWGNCNCQ